jgi:fumarate hydratase subunit beta
LTEAHLHTPIRPEESRTLRVGDIAYFSGELLFCRDKGHVRLREYMLQQRPVPVSFGGIPIYHAGPVVRKADGSWDIIAAGPTTSSRMEEYEADVLRHYLPRIIIGKGGMGNGTLTALVETGSAYVVFPGGAALLAASHIKGVLGVHWLDLGVPDALWRVAVEEFGPCIVTMDSEGESLHDKVGAESLGRLSSILSR